MATSLTPQAAWLIGLLSMLAVLLYYSRNYGLRGAFLLALVWGKILAGVFYILHIDIPVFTVYRYYKGYGYYPVFTVTANMLVFLSFLVTALLTLAWPQLERELGIRGIDFLGQAKRRR